METSLSSDVMSTNGLDIPGVQSNISDAPGMDDVDDELYGHQENDNNDQLAVEKDKDQVDDDEENENPLAGDSDSDDEDIQVTIGDVAPVQFVKGAVGAGAAGKLDMDTTPMLEGQVIYDVDLAQMEEKPWRKPGADINDYFNFGFTEETWNIYCERQKKLRAEFGNNQSVINKNLFTSINLSNPLGSVSSSGAHGYAGGVNRVPTTTITPSSGIPTLGGSNEVNRVLVDNGGNFHAGRHKEPVVRTVINPTPRGIVDFTKPPPLLLPPTSTAAIPNTSAPPPGVDAPPGVEDAPPGTDEKPSGTGGAATALIDTSMPPPGFNPNMPPPNMMAGGPPGRMMGLPPTNMPPPGFNAMMPPPGYPPNFGAPGTHPPGTGMARPLMEYELSSMRRESGDFAKEEDDDEHHRRRRHRRSRSRSAGRSTRRRGETSRTERAERERSEREPEREERRRHRHRSRSASKDRDSKRKRESDRKERSKRDEEGGERKKRSRHDKDDEEGRRDRDKERDRDRKRTRRDEREKERERGGFREEENLEVSDSYPPPRSSQDDGPPGI